MESNKLFIESIESDDINVAFKHFMYQPKNLGDDYGKGFNISDYDNLEIDEEVIGTITSNIDKFMSTRHEVDSNTVRITYSRVHNMDKFKVNEFTREYEVIDGKDDLKNNIIEFNIRYRLIDDIDEKDMKFNV